MSNKYRSCMTTTRISTTATKCCDTRTPSRNDIFRNGQTKREMKRALAAMIEEQKVAMDAAGGPKALYYQRRKVGRQCSCLMGTGSPNGSCLVCFGQEIVGGYDKYGTHTEVLDPTYPNVTSVGAALDFGGHTGGASAAEITSGTPNWRLRGGAPQGSVTFKVPIKTNLGSVDVLIAASDLSEGGEVEYFIRGEGETLWSDLTKANMEAKLSLGYVEIRVELSSFASFSHIFLRYWHLNAPTADQLMDQSVDGIGCGTAGSAVLSTDIPQVQRSHSLGSRGVFNSNGSIQMSLDGTLQSVVNDDWFAFISGVYSNTRWGVTSATAFDPVGTIVNWTVDLYPLQDHNIKYQFPL